MEALGEPPTNCFISKTLITLLRFVKSKIQDVGVPSKNSYNMQVPLKGEKLRLCRLSEGRIGHLPAAKSRGRPLIKIFFGVGPS